MVFVEDSQTQNSPLGMLIYTYPKTCPGPVVATVLPPIRRTSSHVLINLPPQGIRTSASERCSRYPMLRQPCRSAKGQAKEVQVIPSLIIRWTQEDLGGQLEQTPLAVCIPFVFLGQTSECKHNEGGGGAVGLSRGRRGPTTSVQLASYFDNTLFGLQPFIRGVLTQGGMCGWNRTGIRDLAGQAASLDPAVPQGLWVCKHEAARAALEVPLGTRTSSPRQSCYISPR